MADEMQKNITPVTEKSVSQAGYGFNKEISGQEEPEDQKSDTTPVWKDKYLHLLADLENTKKRLTRASALEIEGQNTELLRDVLPISDWLDLALNHIPDKDDSGNILLGIEGLRDILEKLFIKYDVKTIDALGAVFDPNLHEALGMIQHHAAVGNTVVRVERKGYLYRDKLLRPAQVMVAAG